MIGMFHVLQQMIVQGQVPLSRKTNSLVASWQTRISLGAELNAARWTSEAANSSCLHWTASMRSLPTSAMVGCSAEPLCSSFWQTCAGTMRRSAVIACAVPRRPSDTNVQRDVVVASKHRPCLAVGTPLQGSSARDSYSYAGMDIAKNVMEGTTEAEHT